MAASRTRRKSPFCPRVALLEFFHAYFRPKAFLTSSRITRGRLSQYYSRAGPSNDLTRLSHCTASLGRGNMVENLSSCVDHAKFWNVSLHNHPNDRSIPLRPFFLARPGLEDYDEVDFRNSVVSPRFPPPIPSCRAEVALSMHQIGYSRRALSVWTGSMLVERHTIISRIRLRQPDGSFPQAGCCQLASLACCIKTSFI